MLIRGHFSMPIDKHCAESYMTQARPAEILFGTYRRQMLALPLNL